jgi:hypothetical protein
VKNVGAAMDFRGVCPWLRYKKRQPEIQETHWQHPRMDWYYAQGSERKGPIGDEEFRRLAQQGIISSTTLVWREGLAAWQSYETQFPMGPSSVADPNAAICIACGRQVPASEIFILADKPCCAACKPVILQRLQEGLPVANIAAEEIRKAHIQQEASIKSVGVLYFIGAFGLFCMGLAQTLPYIGGAGRAEIAVAGAVFLLMSFGFIATGIGLRRLRRWARIPTGILSGIGLLGFPVGTLINGYILYLVFSKKGGTIFSPEYRDIIQQTPHIKFRTSTASWIILGVILLLIIGGIAAAVFFK